LFSIGESKLFIREINLCDKGQSKILIVSDLHLNIKIEEMEKKLNQLNDIDYHVGVILGDVFEWSYKKNQKESIELFLNFINKSEKKWFAVNGNHDTQDTQDLLTKAGVHIFENSFIDFNDIRLFGFSEDSPFLESEIIVGRKTLLLSHKPDNFINLNLFEEKAFGIAGHTHGGQIKFGNFTPIKNTKRKDMVYGFWDVDGLCGYTTSGIGYSGAPIRLGTRSEAVLIKI
jgi:hypothetical protein